MSAIAILSDIHGNLPAFESVLRDLEQTAADEIIFGGDIVGYGASPKECVELVRRMGGKCVLGNHEFYSQVISKKGIKNLGNDWEENPVLAGVVHALRALSEEELEWIWNLPRDLSPDAATIISHAGLEAPEDWPYLTDLESATPSLEIMKQRGVTVGFFGHIHRFGIFPHLAHHDKKEVYELPADSATAITVGSVGQSREAIDNRAGWVLWDSSARTVEFRRVEYDWKRAAQQIVDAGLPLHSAARLMRWDEADDEDL